MCEKHLAMISTPIQSWGELYEAAQALEKGTIFRELEMPFFVSMQTEANGDTRKSLQQGEREALLMKIDETSFFLDDLLLYLDTHPTDENAIKAYKEKLEERKKLLAEFGEKFYPLTRDCCMSGNMTGNFSWQAGPMPWEGGCGYVVL